eukprot:191646-Rhodomonas_salina.1
MSGTEIAYAGTDRGRTSGALATLCSLTGKPPPFPRDSGASGGVRGPQTTCMPCITPRIRPLRLRRLYRRSYLSKSPFRPACTPTPLPPYASPTPCPVPPYCDVRELGVNGFRDPLSPLLAPAMSGTERAYAGTALRARDAKSGTEIANERWSPVPR